MAKKLQNLGLVAKFRMKFALLDERKMMLGKMTKHGVLAKHTHKNFRLIYSVKECKIEA